MPFNAWVYALNLRAKNSGGTVLATFQAGSFFRGVSGAQSPNTAALSGVFIQPTIIGPPTYEKIELAREGLDWSNDPITVGFRPKLHVEWIMRASEVYGLTGVGLSHLRTVISYLTTVGDYLELSLDGWLSTPNYRKVNLVSNVEYTAIDGKDIGLALALDFEGKALISSVPDLSAGSWGTAT
jgi:hypothetical protein